jgi:hypothetical protein
MGPAQMKYLYYLLNCVVLFGFGCATEQRREIALQTDIHYTATISNGLTADIVKRRDGSIDILFLRGDRGVAQLGSAGNLIAFEHVLRSSNTNAEQTGSNQISVWTRDEKLVKHHFESFDGITEQSIYDRDNDFFPDSRRVWDASSKTSRRELIRYDFVPIQQTKPKSK